jgi:hypothetical protein
VIVTCPFSGGAVGGVYTAVVCSKLVDGTSVPHAGAQLVFPCDKDHTTPLLPEPPVTNAVSVIADPPTSTDLKAPCTLSLTPTEELEVELQAAHQHRINTQTNDAR